MPSFLVPYHVEAIQSNQVDTADMDFGYRSGYSAGDSTEDTGNRRLHPVQCRYGRGVRPHLRGVYFSLLHGSNEPDNSVVHLDRDETEVLEDDEEEDQHQRQVAEQVLQEGCENAG